MRKSILNPFTLRKRFVIIAAIMLAMFAAIGLMACSDDNNPMGGNGNPPVNEVVILSLDSIVYRSTLPTTVDSLINISFTGIDSCKLSFEFESNFPSESALYAGILSMTADTSNFTSLWTLPNTQTMNEAFIIKFVPDTTHTKISITLRHTISPVPAYTFIKLKNIKLYKLI